jgi:hypothetical protein
VDRAAPTHVFVKHVTDPIIEDDVPQRRQTAPILENAVQESSPKAGLVHGIENVHKERQLSQPGGKLPGQGLGRVLSDALGQVVPATDPSTE